MATPLLAWVEKATFTTSQLQNDGGELNTEQARTFLRDAIETTEILSRSDVFDSESRKFEIPKFSFGSRIMRGGNSAKRDMEGARVTSGKRAAPDTDQVTLSTELFKGEVPVPDEVFEDNIEKDGFADTLMEEIAKAVGRDLEDTAIKADLDDANLDYGLFDGVVQTLVDADENVIDASNAASAKEVLRSMLSALPARYRGLWDQLVFYVSVDLADAWADEVGTRGTGMGDEAVRDKGLKPYRSIPLIEVPLLSGAQNGYDYGKVAMLAHPKNLKTGFHRRVRVEKFRDPREGLHSFLPTVRYDVKWAQPEAVVLAEDVPSFSA